MAEPFQGSLFSFDPTPARIERTELTLGAWIDVCPGWLADADGLFLRLRDNVAWRAERRQMYERVVDVPRLVQMFDIGADLPDAALVTAREELNQRYAEEPFVTAGLCYYRTGNDSVAWHGDMHGRGASEDTVIAIVSVGEPRAFMMRPRGGGKSLRFEVGHGDLLVMGGSCQRTWEHAIPKSTRPVGPRISIQFRPAGRLVILRRPAEVVALLALVVATMGVQTQPHQADTSQAEATVTVYGRPGSFGALEKTVPSGQELAKAGVPGWAFPAGRQPHLVVKAGNTLLMAGRDLGNWEHPSSGDLFVGAFDLTAKRLSIVSIPTTASKASVWRDDHATAPSISDILPLDDHTALYTAWPTQLFQDLARDGTWPVLGLLTEVDGRWKAGPSWTGGSLKAAGWDKACPQEQVPSFVTVPANPHQSDCQGLGRMTRLKSGDIVIAQKTGFLIVRVAREGLVELKAQYDFPAGAGSPWEVTAHPVEDRFAVGLRFGSGPPAVQEFKWDKESGAIAAASGLLLPGEPRKGYGAATYDAFGNLWLSRWDGDVTGGALAVFTRPRCAPAAQPVICRPDYDILQARNFGAAQALILDPVTNTVIYLARFGVMQAVRFDGNIFHMSNPVDFGSRLLLGGEGAFVEHRGGVVIGNRVWLTGLQHQPGTVAAPLDQWLYSVNLSDLFTPAPHLLPSDPSWSAIVQIAQTAETGTTQVRLPTAVTNVISNAGFGFCADSPAGSSCATDHVPGNGFYLRDDDSGLGVLRGVMTYQVKVLEAGTYRLSARVFAFPATGPKAVMEISVASQRARIPVPDNPTWAWRNIQAIETITLPVGVHTVTISSQPGEYGWSASSLTWQRI